MNAASSVWPLCPRPQADESLPSWFERVGYEYAMSPALLLGAVEQTTRTKRKVDQLLPASRLYESSVANRLTCWRSCRMLNASLSGHLHHEWELHDLSFCTYCPYCCTADLAEGRSPYGRRVWQQAWCTVCKVHGSALTVRNLAHVPSNRSCWSHAALKVHREFLAANRYRDLKVRSQPAVRSNLLGCLVEIEKTAAAAIAGTAPNPLLWGALTAASFLTILDDVTTWALTHFESVRSGLSPRISRRPRSRKAMDSSGEVSGCRRPIIVRGKLTRSLRDIANPKVRGAALWTAHALLATCHTAASDRASGVTPQERQGSTVCSSRPGKPSVVGTASSA
jgi:hypothetical protein